MSIEKAGFFCSALAMLGGCASDPLLPRSVRSEQRAASKTIAADLETRPLSGVGRLYVVAGQGDRFRVAQSYSGPTPLAAWVAAKSSGPPCLADQKVVFLASGSDAPERITCGELVERVATWRTLNKVELAVKDSMRLALYLDLIYDKMIKLRANDEQKIAQATGENKKILDDVRALSDTLKKNNDELITRLDALKNAMPK